MNSAYLVSYVRYISALLITLSNDFYLFFLLQAYAHPEHADTLEQVYAKITRLAQTEPGIVHYCIARDGDDSNSFHFFERYTGRKAFEEHMSLPIVKKLFEEDKYVRGIKAKLVRAILPKDI